MRIRITDCDSKETWLYNIIWDKVRSNITSYEYIHMYDETLLDNVAIEMAVHKFFGNDAIFCRDMSIRDYIYGTIKKNNKKIRHVFIFFEQ